jgi:hypothetical protein
MAIQVMPILKALAPLMAEAGGIVAGLRGNKTARIEDRVGRLEQETIRAGEVLTGLARQLEAVANQLRVQAEATRRLQRTATIAIVLSSVALVGTGATAILIAVSR